MEIKLASLSTLSHTEFMEKGEFILLNIDTHPLAQEESNPPFPKKAEVKDAFDAFRELNHAAQYKDTLKIAQRDAARKVADEKFTHYGQQLVLRANGDPSKLLGTGYDIHPPRSPKKTIPLNDSLMAALDLSAKHIIVSGQPVPAKGLVKWNSVPGSNAFEVQSAEDPSSEENWTTILHTSHCREEVTGESAKRIYYRIRVLIGQHHGPWSNVTSLLFL